MTRFCAIARKLVTAIACSALLIGSVPVPVLAQAAAPVAMSSDAEQHFTLQQLDALLAPIALYPDELLTQILMAATFPVQVIDAARWVEVPANASLKGSGLEAAMAKLSWDPSVKSLTPFPQVLSMMNANLEWLQQLGYAVETQQADVFDSVQRLRRQSQAAGQLTSNDRQVVRTEGQAVVIVPAQPNVVFVPTYNPTVAFGTWPYPAFPPVFLPPPPGYVVGTALLGGLAFGAGVAITSGLWGWARPNWGGRNVNVNVNRFNQINVNRPAINNSNWRAGGNGRVGGVGANRPGGPRRPPLGPVGAPGRPGGFPANGIGRPSVTVPGNVVRPPAGIGQGNRPPIGGGNRPNLGSGGINRPGGNRDNPIVNRPGGGGGLGSGGGLGTGNRPGFGDGARPGNRPNISRPGPDRGGNSALGRINDGRAAGQFGNRGAQSRQSLQRPSAGGRNISQGTRDRAANVRANGGGGRAQAAGARAGAARGGRGR